MNEFVEVYVFSPFENAAGPGQVFIRLLVGCIVLVVGIYFFRKTTRENKWSPKIFKPVFLLFFAIVWIGLHGLILSTQVISYLELRNIYNNHLYSVVEGKVHVVHEEPSFGHDKGDVILIDGKEFEFSSYDDSYGYHQTISHGGILKEGVYSRLTYCEDPSPYITNNIILRVELPTAK
jgi:hypothetical protein